MLQRANTQLILIVVAILPLAGCTSNKTANDQPVHTESPPDNKPATPVAVPAPQSSTDTVESPSDRRDQRQTGLINWPAMGQWGLPETAADALSRIGEPAVPALIGALSDANPQVRMQAARALARIGPPAKDAVPALTRALNDSDMAVRQNAARALGQIGPDAKDAVPELIQSLR